MFKSPSTRAAIANLSGVLALGAASLGTYKFVEAVVFNDALADYRAVNSPFKDGEGVVIKNFGLKSYIGKKLVTEARVNNATIKNDRSTIELAGIHDGVFYDDAGKKYNFVAEAATYGTYSKSIHANKGIRVFNDTADLKAPGFTYEHPIRRVTFLGDITGKLGGGDLVTKSVFIDLKNKEILTGELSWTGPLQVDNPQKTPWKITAKSSKLRNDITTYTEARGEDKDTIVKADKMIYDRANDIVTAEGNVEYFGVDANVACDKVVIERKINKATLTGKIVRMLIKPEDSAPKETKIPPVVPMVPDSVAGNRPKADSNPTQDQQKKEDEEVRSADNIRHYPIALTAGQIEYWYKKGERKAILTGNPFARQEFSGLRMRWRELYAAKAEYDGEKEELKLTASPAQIVRARNSIGDDITTPFAIISTKKDDNAMETGVINGTVMIDDNELPKKGDGSGSSGGTTGGTGGGSLNGPIGR
ncbi:MAG: hypothetical protein KF824_09595 [Fimbriimonadaceae bacterium]|nr:MAG: hypothetical protein KF824_09595 [Fimbriimonadaceae bacterium]